MTKKEELANFSPDSGFLDEEQRQFDAAMAKKGLPVNKLVAGVTAMLFSGQDIDEASHSAPVTPTPQKKIRPRNNLE